MTKLLSSLFAALLSLVPPLAAAEPEAPLPDTSDPAHGLDLSHVKLTPLYEADFMKPLRYVKEAATFADGERQEPASGVDWVLEGKASASLDGGKLVLTNDEGHLVFWNTREFPADLLIEFTVSPIDSKQGLAILFFSARGREGGSIFAPNQPLRDGVFKTYHSGAINCYHISYWATDATGAERGTSHIRKNFGFHRVALGRDFVAGQGPGPYTVRMLKIGGDISLEVNGKIAVRWSDDGKTLGPVLGPGRIGLRQMAHSKECQYTSFKVFGATKTP